MIKAELKKEAEEKAGIYFDSLEVDQGNVSDTRFSDYDVFVAYEKGALDFAEPRENRIVALEKEKCELLGIIQGKDTAIQELKKKNTKLQQACHKWFMRWREAKKDALYFDSSLQNQIQATLKLQKENAELKENLETKEKVNREMLTPALDRNIKRLTEAKDIINCLVHLGEFNENTDEEYLNYQVHDVLKQAEQFLED